MPSVTLILTRQPADEFIYDAAHGAIVDDIDDLSAEELQAQFAGNAARAARGRKATTLSGRWGTMCMVHGATVHAVQPSGGMVASAIHGAMHQALGHQAQQIAFAGRSLTLFTDAGGLSAPVAFTTAERFRGSTGGLGREGYVHMTPRREPYGLRVERGNRVVKTLRSGHSGDCIRVLGGVGKQKGILIHEAPHVGWVIGCIGPRPLGERGVLPNRDGNPSDLCVRQIIREMVVHGHGKGQLFVLD